MYLNKLFPYNFSSNYYMKIDLVFLIVLGIVVAYIFVLYKVESMADVGSLDQIKEAVKQVYLADVEAIRNLSNVATQLQAGGLKMPGKLTLAGPMVINNQSEQDKIQIYQNGDEKPPYLFFNKQGITGIWNGDKAGWTLDQTGNFIGGNITSGAITAKDNINVSNKTNEGGRIRILNELKNGQAGQTNDWSIWNMTGPYGNKLAFWRYNGDGKNAGPTLELQDDGTINIATALYNKRANFLFNPEDAIIYQNVFDAVGNGTISKSGNGAGWDDTSHKSNLWNGYPILRLGSKNDFPNGAKVKVPEGKSMIWIRLLNERWNSWQIYDNNGGNLGNFTAGYRKLNPLSPDGGTGDAYWNLHIWLPIPVPGPGDYVICPGNKINKDGADGWISGLALTSNPWNLAVNAAISYHWPVNGGDALEWETHDWHNDHLARIMQGKVTTLVVPIVPSGKNKLLYFVEHNNDWNGLMHKSISIDNTPIDRLRTTWDHPLARHVNSKFYSRFAATIIPENLTRGKRFVNVKIDMTGCNHNIYIREIGTVDLY